MALDFENVLTSLGCKKKQEEGARLGMGEGAHDLLKVLIHKAHLLALVARGVLHRSEPRRNRGRLCLLVLQVSVNLRFVQVKRLADSICPLANPVEN